MTGDTLGLDRSVSVQSSGVKVREDVVRIFNAMKLNKSQPTEEEKQQKKKAILFLIEKVDDCESGKSNLMIIPEEGKEILASDVGNTVMDPYGKFVSLMPEEDCRYALYDASFQTKDSSKKDHLVFMMWAPEKASLKQKMLYASSKSAIRKSLPGIKCEWQVNDLCDLNNRDCLISKLGPDVVSFEGSPC